MIGIDYRHVYASKSDDEDSENSLDLGLTASPTRRLNRSVSASPEKLERKGSFRMERKGSFRLERSGSFRLSFHKSESSLRSNNSRRNLTISNDDDDDQSMSSSSNWGNISVSDLAMSVASFAASFHGSAKDNMTSLEPESAVVKLLGQIQDRIDSRRERQKEYKKRRDSCLELALARFEAGSSNNASLVSMRRVDKLRDGLDRVKDAEMQLKDLHSQIHVELQQAKLTVQEGEPVLVDLDLESLRASARKIEEDINARPYMATTDAELVDELKKLCPTAKRKENTTRTNKKYRGGRRWSFRKKLEV